MFLLALGLGATEKSVYLHNRALTGQWTGSEFWVESNQFLASLTSDERTLVQVDPSQNQITVNGQSFTLEKGRVPLLAICQALRLRKVDNNGTLDFVTPAKILGSGNNSSTDNAGFRGRREHNVASKRLEDILKVMPVCDDPKLQERVNRIGQMVADCSPLSDIPWRFVVVRHNVPNAACCGEGSVFVTTGLLDLGVSDDELAGALGHEVAHGVRRHVFRRYDLVMELRLLLNDYQRLSKEVQEAAKITPSLRARVDEYTRRRDLLQNQIDRDIFYSQVDEEEADVLGLRYSTAAGFRADGLGECLSKLDRYAIAQFGTGVTQSDMSHPPVKRRLEILQLARSRNHI